MLETCGCNTWSLQEFKLIWMRIFFIKLHLGSFAAGMQWVSAWRRECGGRGVSFVLFQLFPCRRSQAGSSCGSKAKPGDPSRISHFHIDIACLNPPPGTLQVASVILSTSDLWLSGVQCDQQQVKIIMRPKLAKSLHCYRFYFALFFRKLSFKIHCSAQFLCCSRKSEAA